jgi:cyclopropane fatty-acyl-phospholipid synthase-like methyltransferase
VSENRWETFARENAERYICTTGGVDFSTPDGWRVFVQSGRDDVGQILAEASAHLSGWNRAIEIGCGVGRLAMPMSERFGEVVAVDVAPTMLRRLADNCRSASIENVKGFLPTEPWYEQGAADLIYSLIVFQHIESWDIIAEYCRRMAGCLAKDGVCYVQFDTRPRSLPSFVVSQLPDPLLPRPWRKGIRRIRRSRASLLNLFSASGLTVREELRQDTERHVFLMTAT